MINDNPKPAYPIVNPAQMKPRDQIKLVPEKTLDPLTGAELSNLRAGIPYRFTIADTPQNRENFNFKALYFQMVAYKEGWQFKPENLQVVYLPPNDPRFPQDQSEYRLYEFTPPAANREIPKSIIGTSFPHRISPNGNLGFKIERADSVKQIKPKQADDLVVRINQLFHDK